MQVHVCCVFSLESPQYEEEKHPKLSQICRIFSKGLKNDFETAVVNEPSVFKPLKFYCTLLIHSTPGRVAQLVACLTQEPGVLGSIPGLATCKMYFCFSIT